MALAARRGLVPEALTVTGIIHLLAVISATPRKFPFRSRSTYLGSSILNLYCVDQYRVASQQDVVSRVLEDRAFFLRRTCIQ